MKKAKLIKKYEALQNDYEELSVVVKEQQLEIMELQENNKLKNMVCSLLGSIQEEIKK